MRTTIIKKILLGAGAALVAVAVYYYQHSDDIKPSPSARQTAQTASEVNQPERPASGKAAKTEAVPTPAPDTTPTVDEQRPIAAENEEVDSIPDSQTRADSLIDPVRLAQAELALVKNQMYEAVARETLPTVSIQTHNPVWQLEQEAARQRSQQQAVEVTTAAGDASSSDANAGLFNSPGGTGEDKPVRGPLPAPEFGEFGKMQPPEGEIWLRIPADYAAEHRDIMAQHADLYRMEAGYNGTLTVMLWVGGRPYARHQYD
jgi:type IV secretory pathway VirB10-like protein